VQAGSKVKKSTGLHLPKFEFTIYVFSLDAPAFISILHHSRISYSFHEDFPSFKLCPSKAKE
jgi:hypothetical protein